MPRGGRAFATTQGNCEHAMKPSPPILDSVAAVSIAITTGDLRSARLRVRSPRTRFAPPAGNARADTAPISRRGVASASIRSRSAILASSSPRSAPTEALARAAMPVRRPARRTWTREPTARANHVTGSSRACRESASRVRRSAEHVATSSRAFPVWLALRRRVRALRARQRCRARLAASIQAPPLFAIANTDIDASPPIRRRRPVPARSRRSSPKPAPMVHSRTPAKPTSAASPASVRRSARPRASDYMSILLVFQSGQIHWALGGVSTSHVHVCGAPG